MQIYEALYSRYGDAGWWPAKTEYGVMVSSILTQNTLWSNVERVMSTTDVFDLPERLLALAVTELTEIIKPTGSYGRKATCIISLTEWFKQYRFCVREIKQQSIETIRQQLLQIPGIGKETADAILLYAFGFTTFVIDSYTLRLLSRYPYGNINSYDQAKILFETELDSDLNLYRNYHALVVINGKQHCRKNPHCSECPLSTLCMKKGLQIF
jgi:endonuclease-3 related protein